MSGKGKSLNPDKRLLRVGQRPPKVVDTPTHAVHLTDVPGDVAITGQVATWNGVFWVAADGAVGTLTSIGLEMPKEFEAPVDIDPGGSSPLTADGKFIVRWINQAGRVFLASPYSGAAGEPGFRIIDVDDLGTGADGAGLKHLADDRTWKTTPTNTGTVTSVSGTNANGVSWTITDPTGAVNLTITLGAITPTSVNGITITTGSGTLTLSTFTVTVTGNVTAFSGSHTGASSNTNTGDQTITLTGDVTGSGTSSFAATIANDAVTFAKMANLASDRLIGRDTAGSGDPEALTVGGGVEFTGSGGIQTSALTGDVTKSAGGTATTIANDAVTYAKMQNVSAASKLLGRGDSGSGDPQELTLGTNLSMSGTTVNAASGGATALYLQSHISASGWFDTATHAQNAWHKIDVATVGFALAVDSASGLSVVGGDHVECSTTGTYLFVMTMSFQGYLPDQPYLFAISDDDGATIIVGSIVSNRIDGAITIDDTFTITLSAVLHLTASTSKVWAMIRYDTLPGVDGILNYLSGGWSAIGIA